MTPDPIVVLNPCPRCKTNFHLHYEKCAERGDARVVCSLCGVSGPYMDYECTEFWGRDYRVDVAWAWNELFPLAEEQKMEYV